MYRTVCALSETTNTLELRSQVSPAKVIHKTMKNEVPQNIKLFYLPLTL